ncbi:phage terminase small subunit [Thermoanaerobacterium sp. CMT5567-10]|uniref:phage terminase small subunit n=1 Tax=Thermoanaerobacterium sp. CMT5567-10 TaxID=3061989 RepID=UPI0026DF7194|nr:phage terminase small subunit [Thermoanaerobacterium sp. CMT5567-10]WKV08186.1 phage terminase small subunit [Thermoanaerobacterium sp. CMT5567-10]
MDEIKDQVKKDYLLGMKYNKICEKYNLSINTLKSWVKRYNWSKEKKEGAHKEKKRGAPKGNKNALGNDGGAPFGNKNAEKHGLFSKYLPQDTLDIIDEIQKKDPLDLLWDQIVIQYSAIIRAQKIMYVKDQNDLSKVLKRTIESENISEKEYELQFAWDKQANFLQAQSRAMAELRNLISKYSELLNTDLATEEQKLRIQKIKVDIERLKEDDPNKIVNINVKLAGDNDENKPDS